MCTNNNTIYTTQYIKKYKGMKQRFNDANPTNRVH